MTWVLHACGAGADDAGTTTTTISRTTATTVGLTTTTVAGTTMATRAGGATSTAVTRGCASIGFTPDSEDAASDITATGLSCAEAESFVRLAGQRTSASGPPEVVVSDYRCVLTPK